MLCALASLRWNIVLHLAPTLKTDTNPTLSSYNSKILSAVVNSLGPDASLSLLFFFTTEYRNKGLMFL